ncbi:hypothetical protein MOV08_21040 [Streptomyces yunnanensis]|uniref:Hydrophobic W protein n=1 Tax=Streptomyces yunnanensis TaxID=156453 RepID=A0ABY8A9P5_9ACTN|nr:hypothetical protein [Streptomyces yunnanensis]WEB41508.1 hypothetical protein MOV08_21040 [Streptomyces yunnanensis]
MAVRAAWLTTRGDSAGGQTREDTRRAPLGMMTPVGEWQTDPGILPGAGGDQTVIGGLRLYRTGPMTCRVLGGRAVVQGTTEQGAYPVLVDNPVPLPVENGDATNPRVDLVVLRVYDDPYDSSGRTEAAVEILQGTPSPRPTPPEVPPCAIPLYEITVPAGTSSGSGGIDWGSALRDRRFPTVAVGGIVPAGTAAGRYAGQYRDNGRALERFNGQSWGSPLEDTGWQPMPLGGSVQNISYAPCHIRRIGNVVYLRGRAEKRPGLAEWIWPDQVIARIPEGLRPYGGSIYTFAAARNRIAQYETCRLEVKSNGELYCMSGKVGQPASDELPKWVSFDGVSYPVA